MRIFATSTLILAFALAGCGKGGVAGSYRSDAIGMKGVVLTLKPDGKAVYLGAVEWPYEVDGKDVKLIRPEGTLILKGREDGSLDFPLIGNLKKEPS
jgi:hypothetical protein